MTTRRDQAFEFTWIDAYCPEDQWYDRDEFVINKRIMKTTGWVLAQDREYMIVASTYDAEAGLYSQVMCIPRGCIEKIRGVVPEDGRSGGGSGDPGGDLDDDPAGGEESEAGDVLPVLVGVPDPGGFDLWPPAEEVDRKLRIQFRCGCKCHDPVYAGTVHAYGTSCCDRPDQPHEISS